MSDTEYDSIDVYVVEWKYEAVCRGKANRKIRKPNRIRSDWVLYYSLSFNKSRISARSSSWWTRRVAPQ